MIGEGRYIGRVFSYFISSANFSWDLDRVLLYIMAWFAALEVFY